ncbi:SurA N-terminal domain-containing protein [Notoacmeibacter sp. MSK16QG-6]|uniref:SurA N-terminal domain-containing protein n=1 Tax=Notoacmeibacter sp. MSK16QG-6 TaxID=2957982 RepID=UPI00209CDAB5|nr:SurA N-terminal domain-containing protein [Notoacmeibacter sp. MSK16QG-6]MCP1199331.1 SurA N-terminal domain-containing protein [Notoacmeibacter sp. MSK16QG-6]
MLQMLRQAAGTWVAKLLLLLLVASFAVWGISGQVSSGFGNKVVVAGDASASAVDYRLAYDRQLLALSRQFGQRLTREQARSLGLDNQALAELVSGTLLDAQASDLGLGLSRQRLAQIAGSDPTFRGPDGRFDRGTFDAVLREVGMRPEDYLRSQSQVAVRQQIVSAIADGTGVPDAFFSAVALYRGERRNADYLILTPEALPSPAAPADDELAKWYEQNSDSFDAPEYRDVSLLVLDAQAIADPEAISDDEVAAEYERTKNRYGQPEKRTVEQILYPDRPAAEDALAKLKGDADFDTLLSDAGRTASQASLGSVAKSDISDPEIAEAAFGLDGIGTTGIVEGKFGPAILRVTDVTPASVKPFEEVASEIRQEMALVQARNELLDRYDSYEDARAAGDTMSEAAEKIGVPVRRIEAIDAQGNGKDGKPVADLPDADKLLSSVFGAEEGLENPAENLKGDGFVFYEINTITPTRPRPLDEVSEDALAAYQAEKSGTAVSDLAKALQQRLREGEELSAIAEELGLTVQQASDLKREGQSGALDANAAEAIFAVPAKGTGQVRASEGQSNIVFRVTDVFRPVASGADSVPSNDQDAFDRAVADDLLRQLVDRLETIYAPQIDQAAAQRALSF